MHNHSFSSLLSESIEGKVVLVRVDFNAPIKDGAVADDTRLRASIDTIQSLTNKGAKVVLVSHLSRPGGKVVDSLRLNPIQVRLKELLQQDVKKVDELRGVLESEAFQTAAATLKEVAGPTYGTIGTDVAGNSNRLSWYAGYRDAFEDLHKLTSFKGDKQTYQPEEWNHITKPQ